jgi:uncharacterized protein YbbC (DUF1343 family)
MLKYRIVSLFMVFFLLAESKAQPSIITGAEQTERYIPLLKDKNIAVVTNQTGIIGQTHIVDSLLSLKVQVKKIFAPEHGFRGEADAGEQLKSSKDKRTGLPIVSLYGEHEKPLPADLTGIDIVLFDIQDVGVRFYTYLSTLHYVMEACAENKKTLIVLDRPNPNAFYIDGPVLEKTNTSFVGLHPVPIVYGMTIGEYALMINGESWLKAGVRCNLSVIPLKNYSHKSVYELPVKPSPNLPNLTAIYLYPSLALFEGTSVSVGRGTDFPFQVMGNPNWKDTTFSFTPHSTKGAKDPMYKGRKCYGTDFRQFDKEEFFNKPSLMISKVQEAYNNTPDKEKFFVPFFNLLAGNNALKQQIISGMKEEDIRKTWEPGIKQFKDKRRNYLLYADFE